MSEQGDEQRSPRVTPGEAANELHNTVDTVLETMMVMRKRLREVQATLGPVQFNQWAKDALDLDEATARDFLAFDGTMQSITDRIISYFERRGVS